MFQVESFEFPKIINQPNLLYWRKTDELVHLGKNLQTTRRLNFRVAGAALVAVEPFHGYESTATGDGFSEYGSSIFITIQPYICAIQNGYYDRHQESFIN